MNPSTLTATSSNVASTAAKLVLVSSVVIGCTYFLDSRGNRVISNALSRGGEDNNLSTKKPLAEGVRPNENETERATVGGESESSQEEEQIIAPEEVEAVREDDKGGTKVELKDPVGAEEKKGKAEFQVKDTLADFTKQAEEERNATSDDEAVPEPKLLMMQLLVTERKSGLFEVLQLEVDPRKASVGDILSQVAVTATELPLRTQKYDGICLLDGTEIDAHTLLEDCFRSDDGFAIAIPSGVTGFQMSEYAERIMRDTRLSGLFKNIVDMSAIEDIQRTDSVPSESNETKAEVIPRAITLNVSDPIVAPPASLPVNATELIVAPPSKSNDTAIEPIVAPCRPPNQAEKTTKTSDNDKETSPSLDSSGGWVRKTESSETSITKGESSDENSSQDSSGSEKENVSAERPSKSRNNMRGSSLKKILTKLPKRASIRLSSRA